jgi:hypothetical protein
VLAALENMACSAVLFSVRYYLLYSHLLVFPSLPWAFIRVYTGEFIPVAVWETARHLLRDFLTQTFSFICCGILKSVALGNPSLGEVVGYLQEGLNNVESESDCAIGSDHNTDCVAAEQQNEEVY